MSRADLALSVAGMSERQKGVREKNRAAAWLVRTNARELEQKRDQTKELRSSFCMG